MTQTAIAVKTPVAAFKGVLSSDSIQSRLKEVVKDNIGVFSASLIEVFSGSAQLQKCNPSDLIKEALRAATLKLPLNSALGHAYIVPFGSTPTLVIGYKGYIQLAMRSGQYKTINADVVYEGELSVVDKLTGTISFDGEKKSDKIVGYFCYFELMNGFNKTLYMKVEEVARYAKKFSKTLSNTTYEALVSKANQPNTSSAVGWNGDFNAMAIKTVVRRLITRYGPLSIDMQQAFSENADSSVDNEPQDNGNVNTEDIQFEEVKDNGDQSPPQAPPPPY